MGKKFFGALLFALLFGCLLHVSAWAETAVVTGSDVNMREGPGTNFRIIGCLPAGAYVTVTDRSNGTWYGVEYNGVTGFMSGNFLEITEEESARPVQNAAQDVLGGGIPGYVNAMYVRFRSAPGSDYSVRGEYNRGKPLLYYFTDGDWAACIIDGVPGYIYADFVAFGSFDGYGSAGTGGEQPLNLRITETPTPTPPADRTPTPSDQLALEHASTPDVEQTPGYINANYVRFRKGPGSNYPIIDTYNAGTAIGVTGVYMDWTAGLIDGAFGFIYSDYVTIPGEAPAEENFWEEESETATVVQTNIPLEMPEITFAGVAGYVAGNNVRMRSAASMSAPIVTELSYGNVLNIVGRTGDWAAAICGNKAGYIYGQFVKLGTLNLGAPVGAAAGSTPAVSAAPLGGSSLEKGQQIAQFAVQFVGCPYSWGGKDPSGFDCSGLVYYVYQQFGITLNRVAQEQAQNGVHVDPANLQPGDVLCFYSGSSYIGHAGIYIGNGMFVHAQNSATGVVITELAGHYADRGFEARRIV